MALPLPTSLSPSKVAAFRDCALAFRYAAIDRLPEAPTEPAAKGTLVHRALERLHMRPAHERTLDAALADLELAVDEVLGSDEYASLELADRDAFVAEAEALVRRYFTIEDPASVRTIGVELRFEVSVGGVPLRGVIDRLELDGDGGLVVTDYKTGKVPGERYENGKLGGVRFYAYACEALFGVRPSRIQLLYVQEPVMIVATPSDQSIVGLEKRVGAIWTAVERACEREDFRPQPGRLCSWCSFKSLCPAWAGQEVA